QPADRLALVRPDDSGPAPLLAMDAAPPGIYSSVLVRSSPALPGLCTGSGCLVRFTRDHGSADAGPGKVLSRITGHKKNGAFTGEKHTAGRRIGCCRPRVVARHSGKPGCGLPAVAAASGNE